MSRSWFGRRWAGLCALALAVGLLAAGGTARAQAPATATVTASSAALQQAQALFDQSDFTAAQSLLREKLGSGEIRGSEVKPARELLARCLVRSGNRVEAKEAFKGLIRKFPGYRPDAQIVSPQEQEVFAMAEAEVRAEQIRSGNRIPASLSFSYGSGAGENKDMSNLVDEFARLYIGPNEPAHKYEAKPQFGGAVRFPVGPKTSIEVELQRLRATTSLTLPSFGDRKLDFEVSGVPISVSVYQAAFTRRAYRFNVFAGAGIFATAVSDIDYKALADLLGGVPLKLSGEQKRGSYLHAGLEGEYLVTPRIAVTGRVMGRQAKAKDVIDQFLFDDSQTELRSVDFSGFGATFGLRAYIGY